MSLRDNYYNYDQSENLNMKFNINLIKHLKFIPQSLYQTLNN